MPNMSRPEKTAMRIIGFFRKDSGETMHVSNRLSSFFMSGELTSSALLVELLLTDRSGLDDETIPALSSALALVVPFVA